MKFTLMLLLLLAAPVQAQHSGLLLGTSYQRTLWIAPIDGKLAVVTRLPGVVVPRTDGWWIVDVQTSCGVSDGTMEMTGPFLDTRTDISARPFGTESATPDPDAGHLDCEEARARVASVPRDSLEEHQEGTCNIDESTITYVSPRVYSYSNYSAQTEACSPGRYVASTFLTVAAYDSSFVSLLEHLPAPRAAVLQKLWEEQKGECAFEETPDANWGITRGFGAWIVQFSSTGSTACRGDGGGAFSIEQVAPAALARREPLEGWLPQLKRALPDIEDIFISPKADLILARRGAQLVFFKPADKTLGRPVLSVALQDGETIVMAEWATGSHVQRWTRELSAMAASRD